MNILVKHLCKIVQSPGDEKSRFTSAYGLLELSKHAQQSLHPHLSSFLPLAFMGRTDDNETTKDLWSNVWDENTASVDSGIRLFTKELVDMATNMLSAQHWTLKRQAASSLNVCCIMMFHFLNIIVLFCKIVV